MTNGDDRQRLDRLGRLGIAVRRVDARCADLVTQLDAALRYRDSTPKRLEGWHLEAVIAVFVAAFLAELFAVARLADGLGLRDAERAVLSAIVAACLVGTGFLIGDMLRHRRIDREEDVLSRVAIAAACMVALALLASAWAPYLANAAGRARLPAAGMVSLTLGILVLALPLVPVAASYYREASSTARARRRVAWLQRRLRAHERLSDRKHDERANVALQLKIVWAKPRRAERGAGSSGATRA